MNPTFGFDSPFGRLSICTGQGRVIRVGLPQDGAAEFDLSDELTSFGRRVLQQLQAYFADPRNPFDLPLAQVGTPFQQRVWAGLQAIPTGSTRSYGVLARELGTSPRALGNACRANPYPILVPCHRVVAARGLGGYAGSIGGQRLEIKRWLLTHEGAL